MKRSASLLSRIIVVVLPLLALLPIWRITADWGQLARVVDDPSPYVSERGFDWVVWKDLDGKITATYVAPNGPGAEAGIQRGDVFFALENQQLFNAADVRRAVESIRPGAERTYALLRDGAPVEVPVRLQSYPTFLYPLSSFLWHFSLWGFAVSAFVHILALLIVAPMYRKSGRARRSLLLIAASALWVVPMLLRLGITYFYGPPASAMALHSLLEALTLVAIIGWVTFPVLLLHTTLRDLYPGRFGRRTIGRYWPFTAPLLLAVLAVAAFLTGSLGPFTLAGLTAPLLFYICCYLGAAAALVLLRRWMRRAESRTGWPPAAAFLLLLVSLAGALSVYGIVPLFGAVNETTAGWIVVCVQLLSVVPVILVSLATLRHGKAEQVVTRALANVGVYGLFFLLNLGLLALLVGSLSLTGTSTLLAAALIGLSLLILFDQIGQRLRTTFARILATDRERKQRRLRQLQIDMRTLYDVESLTHHVVEGIGEALSVRSAILYVRQHADEEEWVSRTFHPEPPYFTDALFHRLQPHFLAGSAIWAANAELDECDLPEMVDRELHAVHASLVLPVHAGDDLIGLLALGHKTHRRQVYNLDDVEMLRAFLSHLALAVERLHLVERERALAREHAQAQLVALRAQINPHFLFNTLNTIASLIDIQPQQAERVVEHLSAIFRHVLNTESQSHIPLRDELDLVRRYLAIERARFGEALDVSIEAEEALLGSPIPAFALQTLVENAVQHGIARKRGGGAVRLAITRVEAGDVLVTLSDDGAGLPPDAFGARENPPSFFGTGLTNVYERMRQLYGRTDLLYFERREGGGTRVQIRLPDAASTPTTIS